MANATVGVVKQENKLVTANYFCKVDRQEVGAMG